MDIYNSLRRFFGEDFYRKVLNFSKNICINPFETLVGTIISQNTNRRNTLKAFKELKKNIVISPQNILDTPIYLIEESLKGAGLYRIKSRRLKIISKIIVDEFGGDFNKIFEMDPMKLRKFLLSLPGVGYKTADIILLFCLKYPIMPVDTHISRIVYRLGLTSSKIYEDIRNSLEKYLDKSYEKYVFIHLALIEYGRKICMKRRPKCDICIFRDDCRWYFQNYG
ncbi:MAG: endonuclease III [Thermoprotei archaeon]|nr:MAG: endonuclease III [Thermoprotei archaeon]